MANLSERHQTEVAEGRRFEFGKNWSSFLSNLTAARIRLAEDSLRTFLGTERLDGKRFLDIGSGSGLFSLVARRLGATVHSFDYDPQSVACTRELRRRYFTDDPNWIIEEGSVLDKDYLRSLGTFDIVYSWGVLHHTGAMYDALENVKPLVPVGGQLYIAIYNDQGDVTDHWAHVKRRYNTLPRPLAKLYALAIIGISEAKQLANHYRHGTIQDWLRTWTEYDLVSKRGMSRWHDWIDWIGGYPYERATIEQIVDIFSNDGFSLTKLFDCSDGSGCNEFLFVRMAPAGTSIDTQLPGGRSMARHFGSRVREPFERGDGVWTGRIATAIVFPPSSSLYLISNDEILFPMELTEDGKFALASNHNAGIDIAAQKYYVVSCRECALSPPFEHVRGKMWQKVIPDLTELADRIGDDKRSPVYIFEDNRQLAQPHSKHDDIDAFGAGRFSHWGSSIYFSTSDNTDPNKNGRIYRLLIGVKPADQTKSLST